MADQARATSDRLRFVSNRGTEITYPPPVDIRYGELVRLRNRARELGLVEALADLQWRVDHFFDQSAQRRLL